MTFFIRGSLDKACSKFLHNVIIVTGPYFLLFHDSMLNGASLPQVRYSLKRYQCS